MLLQELEVTIELEAGHFHLLAVGDKLLVAGGLEVLRVYSKTGWGLLHRAAAGGHVEVATWPRGGRFTSVVTRGDRVVWAKVDWDKPASRARVGQ